VAEEDWRTPIIGGLKALVKGHTGQNTRQEGSPLCSHWRRLV